MIAIILATSIPVVLLGTIWFLIIYWDRKAGAKKQKEYDSKYPKARMVLLVILVLAGSCVGLRSAFHPDFQQQVTLVRVARMYHHQADLVCVNRNNDSVYLKYGWVGNKPVFEPGTKITVQYDTCKYKIVDQNKYYQSVIKINN